MRRRITQQQQWGYDVRAIGTDEWGALEPRIQPGAMLATSYAPQEGFTDPAATNRLLVRKAAAAGARVVYPCEVTGFDVNDAAIRSVKTSRDTFTADVVIVCGGTATPRIAAMAGVKVPLVPAPGLLLHTRPMPPLVNRVVNGPDAHIKQYRDGRMVIGDDLGPPSTDVHDYLRDEPADFPDPAFRELHRQRILKKAAEYLPQVAKASVERITIGYRPLPKDGYPIVGFTEACRNLYLAVTHSGVTLAPALGELASIEILERVRVQALENCRLARFGA
jgi:glycine/D-amino acid oxidase-like deaminating enzyme